MCAGTSWAYFSGSIPYWFCDSPNGISDSRRTENARSAHLWRQRCPVRPVSSATQVAVHTHAACGQPRPNSTRGTDGIGRRRPVIRPIRAGKKWTASPLIQIKVGRATMKLGEPVGVRFINRISWRERALRSACNLITRSGNWDFYLFHRDCLDWHILERGNSEDWQVITLSRSNKEWKSSTNCCKLTVHRKPSAVFTRNRTANGQQTASIRLWNWSILRLTLSPPIPSRLYTLPYWSNPPFLIFDIRALWRSGLSARAPECQKLKMVG